MSDPGMHDHQERYCPRLGHELSFAYCRHPGADTPCNKILDCWWERVDIKAYMAEHHPDSAPQAPAMNRVTSLFDLMTQAQQRAAAQQAEQDTDDPA